MESHRLAHILRRHPEERAVFGEPSQVGYVADLRTKAFDLG